MSILNNGQLIPEDVDILLDKWKCQSVYGNEQPPTPEFCIFKNVALGLEMLKHHVDNDSNMVFHTDVDVDGIGTTYIMKKTLDNLNSNKHCLFINKDKVHGISERHANFFNKTNVGLMIITDSSCNDVDIIKQFNCDVLCIDHHDLLHTDTCGVCNDGVHRYIIINSTIDNDTFEHDSKWLRSKNISAFENINPHKGTQAMSCGLVVYEFLRLYCECFANPKLLENLMLYQWVGITLITDVIDTLNDRNQWYLNKTVFNNYVEQSLRIMMPYVNKNKATLDKSYIEYSFAPLINKAIRAGQSATALDIVINRPQDISLLSEYAKQQQDAVNKACYVSSMNFGNEVLTPKLFSEERIIMNISDLGINKNYSGVIASRLCGDNHKNAAVFVINDNQLYKGSFRGRYKEVNYRKHFESIGTDVYAQGHPGAFGFEMTKEQLEKAMNTLTLIEPNVEPKPLLSLGNIDPSKQGIYHITDLNNFKKLGYIWKISIGNSKVTSGDEINIRVSASDVVLKSTKGKLFIYDVCGLECKAFSALTGKFFNVYAEYTNEINFYIRQI